MCCQNRRAKHERAGSFVVVIIIIINVEDIARRREIREKNKGENPCVLVTHCIVHVSL